MISFPGEKDARVTDFSFVYGCRRVDQRERESRAREGDYMKRKGELLDVRTEA